MNNKDAILTEAKNEQLNGNYQKTLELLEQIFDIDNYDISFEYAKTLYFLKRYDAAIDILLTINDKNHGNNNVINILIKAYKESNKLEQLLIFIKKNNIENDSIFLEVAETMFFEKRYIDSAYFYEQYIRNNQNNIDIVSKLLQIYNFVGYKQKAVDLANQYLQKTDIKNNIFLSNLFLNELEIAQEKIILNSKPRIILAMLTNKCNLKCPMCATVRQNKRWDISEEFRKYILSNLPTLELITWQGGEVFLYKGFEKLFLEASKNKYLKQIIITNGLLINEKWADLISLANHLDLTISIDSIEKSIYEKLRYGGDFDQLLVNLESIKKARNKNNSNITVSMRTTISDENIYTLEQIVDFAARYCVNVLILSPLNIHDNQKYDFTNKTKNELIRINNIIINALQKAKQSNIKVINMLADVSSVLKQMNLKDLKNKEINKISNKDVLNNCVKEEKLPLCFRPWKQIATTVDGEIKPECMCIEQIDNIHMCKNVNSLWNSEIMQEYRRKLLNYNEQWCCDSCRQNIVSQEHKKFTCW